MSNLVLHLKHRWLDRQDISQMLRLEDRLSPRHYLNLSLVFYERWWWEMNAMKQYNCRPFDRDCRSERRLILWTFGSENPHFARAIMDDNNKIRKRTNITMNHRRELSMVTDCREVNRRVYISVGYSIREQYNYIGVGLMYCCAACSKFMPR